MTTSTLASLTELVTSEKTDQVLVQDAPGGSAEDKRETINNLLATPVDLMVLNERSEPATPSAGKVYRYAGTDGNTYIKTDTGEVKLESAGQGAASNHLFEARITPTTGKPVEHSSQSAVTSIFISPYNGNQARVYDGSNWAMRTIAEQEIKLTDAQGGAVTNGSPVVFGLTDTSHFVVGTKVSGTNIPAGATIASIDSATQVTMSANATGDGPGITVTFKAPASSVFALYAYDNSGTLAYDVVKWTNATTRSVANTTQDGIKVMTGDATKLFIGDYATFTTDGQTEWDRKHRLIRNEYHKKTFEWWVNYYSSYNLTSSTFIKWNGADADSKIWGLVDGNDYYDIRTDGQVVINGSFTTGYLQHGIGLDSESVDSADYSIVGLVSASDETSRHPVASGMMGVIAEGYHYICGINKYITNQVTSVFPTLRSTGGFLG